MHYGNNPVFPAIVAGDLAAYVTVRAGAVKVKVLELRPINAPSQSYVIVRVTSRNHYTYRCGELLHVSPLWLRVR
jgi:hypothetical protein